MEMSNIESNISEGVLSSASSESIDDELHPVPSTSSTTSDGLTDEGKIKKYYHYKRKCKKYRRELAVLRKELSEVKQKYTDLLDAEKNLDVSLAVTTSDSNLPRTLSQTRVVSFPSVSKLELPSSTKALPEISPSASPRRSSPSSSLATTPRSQTSSMSARGDSLDESKRVSIKSGKDSSPNHEHRIERSGHTLSKKFGKIRDKITGNNSKAVVVPNGISGFVALRASDGEHQHRVAKILREHHFGVHLDKQVRGSTLPIIFQMAIAVLHNPQPGKIKQILCSSDVEQERVLALREKIENSGAVEFSKTTHEEVGGLLKLWIMQLPEPIIPESILKSYETEVSGMNLDRTLSLLNLRFLVYSLPTNNRVLLEALCFYLQGLPFEGEATANIQELAEVFGPLICDVAPDMHIHRTASVELLAALCINASHIFPLESVEFDAKFCFKEGNCVVKATTLPRLLQLLITYFYNEKDFMDTIAKTWPYYSTAEDFMSQIAVLFKELDAGKKISWRSRARLDLLALLKLWIDTDEHDRLLDNTKFVTAINGFVAAPRREVEEENNFFDYFSDSFDQKAVRKMIRSKSSKLRVRIKVDNVDILEFGRSELAAQLSVVDHRIFRAIPMREFLKKAYTKPESSPHFQLAANRFNEIGLWTATEILQRKTVNDRVEIMRHFISLADKCAGLGNFFSCGAIVGGLFWSSVQRLKHTLDKLPSKSTRKMNKLQNLLSMDKNYKLLREAMQNTTGPLIPHLGILTKDLLAIEEGNSDTVDGLINFQKMRLIHTQLAKIRKYQASGYDNVIHQQTLQVFLANMNPLDEQELYKLSKEIEPSTARTSSNISNDISPRIQPTKESISPRVPEASSLQQTQSGSNVNLLAVPLAPSASKDSNSSLAEEKSK